MNQLPRKPYLFALAATFGLVFFYYFCGGIWRPIKARLTGERTVEQVLRELEPLMDKRFEDLEGLTNGEPMSILAIKDEQRIELWKQRGTRWQFVRTYPFTGFSGKLGPKLKEGDRQIPEGVYRIGYLNPKSSYHLSIKVDYPNAFDREMASVDGREKLGFDIFIHGSTSTVGCIPIGDQGIEELFYLVAKNGFRNVSIIISPVDFRRGVAPPEVDGIDWEANLYAHLSERLKEYALADTAEKSSANKASDRTPQPLTVP